MSGSRGAPWLGPARCPLRGCAAPVFGVMICRGECGALPRAGPARAPLLALWLRLSVLILIAFPGSALTPVCSRPSPLYGPSASSQLPSASLHRPSHLISLRSALRTLRHSVFRRNVAWTTLNDSRIIGSVPLPGCFCLSPHY